MSNIAKQFLSTLRGARTNRRTSAAGLYWSAATCLAEGREPSIKPAALAEALERVGRDEDQLAADAQRIAKLMQFERVAAKETDAKTRLKTATTAQAAADRRAAELLAQADRVRAEAAAIVSEARNEADVARGAAQRADALRLELARLGHPDFSGEAEKRKRQRAIEQAEAELRSMADELRERAADVDALPVADTHQVSADRSDRARGRLALTEERHARLVARLESLRNGGPIDVEGNTDDDDDFDDVEPMAEEVGRG